MNVKKRRAWLCLLVCCLAGCSAPDNALKIGASPVPHAEILEMVAPTLKEQGVVLKIIEIDDYNTPNRLLIDKQLDANFFQHKPFLDLQNSQLKSDLVPLVAVHIEPLGIYSSKISSLSEVPIGAKVVVPQDPTNEARALALLEAKGLIALDHSKGQLVTVLDIVKNPKKLKIEEVDASLLPRTLPDVTLAVIPANFALQTGLNPEQDALALEGKESDYANIVVVRKGDEHLEAFILLKEALTSAELKNALKEKYAGAVAPAY